MKKNVLVVAAHPDDEVLGCGGTVARLVREGYRVQTLILGEGITSRQPQRDRAGQKAGLEGLAGDCRQASRVLGISGVKLLDFPDNRFDTVALLDIVKAVEEVKKKVRPALVFTHCPHDLNVDHQIVFRAVLTAFRPLPKEPLRSIYAFETLSSTEWSFDRTFSPDCFFDISGTIQRKLKAMSCYRRELRNPPHPRSLRGIQTLAAFRGMQAGFAFAEAFQTVRMLR